MSDEYYPSQADESEFIITDDPEDTSIIVPLASENEEEQYDDENDIPVFFDCDELRWLWDCSQWRALPNHMRVALLRLIHEEEEQLRPRVYRIIKSCTGVTYFYKAIYKQVEADFAHWLVEDYLVNMDYYDPFIILREDYNTRDENYISTARTTFATRFIINADIIEETFLENPNESDEVDDEVYI